MELVGFLQIVSRRRWVLVITTILTVMVAAAGTLLATPLYRATATLRVGTALAGSLDYIGYDVNYADRLMNTYVSISTSARMRGELQKQLGLSKSPTLIVGASPKSELLQITVEDPSPVLAANAANTLSELLIEYVESANTKNGKTAQQMISEQLAQADKELQQARNQYASLVAATPVDPEAVAASSRLLGVKEETYASLLGMYDRVRVTQTLLDVPLSLVEPATIPQEPSQPRKTTNMGLGLFIGLLAGIGLAFLLENLDTTLNTTEQIEQATERTVLGSIPLQRLGNGRLLNGHSPGNEAFLQVRTSLLSFTRNASPQTLLVTSAEAGEGKSTIAVNLASALAQTRRQVLLIDCDFRLPTLHKILDLPNDLGLSDVLKGEKAAQEVQQFNSKSGAWAITSGVLPPNPAELLDLPEMAETIRQSAQQFDYVILDAPSLLAVTDPVVLASKVDVALLVVDGRQARKNVVKAACRVLDDSGVKSIGIIVNRAGSASRHDYYLRGAGHEPSRQDEFWRRVRSWEHRRWKRWNPHS